MDNVSTIKLTRLQWLLFLLAGALFLFLRLRSVGHLLVFDEAMTICTVRSFAAGAQDQFATWFWRHPPLFHFLMALLSPAGDGFIGRVELLAVLLNSACLVAMVLLNRRLFGNGAALIAAFVLAALPGSAFFSVWIKADHLALLFGLLALLSLSNERNTWAGLCLGLAVLSKETAIFFVVAANLLWLTSACGPRRSVAFLKVNLPVVIAAAAWYLVVLPLVNRPPGAGALTFNSLAALLTHGALAHLKFGLGADPNWHQPWYYYLGQLRHEIGMIGIALAVIGICVCVAWMKSTGRKDAQGWLQMWPIMLIIPALAGLSCLPAKVPWLTIALAPGWATIIALGINAITSHPWHKRGSNPYLIPTLMVLAGGSILVAAAITPMNYERMLQRVDASQWRGASQSRDLAALVNHHARDGDRLLLTSFHYWAGLAPGRPCPVFTCYLKRQVTILLRSHQITADEVVADARRFRLDWALLSPEPGAAEMALFGGLDQDYHCPTLPGEGAFLFDLRNLPGRTGPTNSSKDNHSQL